MMVISCSAGYGSGGLGRHLRELVEAGINDGMEVTCLSPRPPTEGPKIRSIAISTERIKRMLHRSPLRLSPGWTQVAENAAFDRSVAAALPPATGGKTVFTGFGGQSLISMQRARKLGYTRIDLVAANSHVSNVQRLHRMALARWPIESSWLNEHQVRRTLEEYALADRIIVASEYTRRSFIDEGVAENKLIRFNYRADSRYVPAVNRLDENVFRIVSTGSLTVMKGIPLLIEVFVRFDDRPAELVLVGGSSSRGMRRYLENALKRDSRVRLAPGDPLPILHRADLFVHPSYEDGLAYAPLEAMNCGVPTIVTNDTGAKEFVLSCSMNRVVPTGDSEALLAAIRELASDLP